MRRLWPGVRAHRLAALFFLGLWLATWLVTVVTWERDAAGFSIGMAPFAIPLHLLLPLVLGALMWLTRSDAPGTLLRTCALAGAIFGIVHAAVFSLVDLLWLPQVESPPPFAELAAGALLTAAMYAGACAGLSVIGGGFSRACAARLRGRG
jgi:hypothetical protein